MMNRMKAGFSAAVTILLLAGCSDDKASSGGGPTDPYLPTSNVTVGEIDGALAASTGGAGVHRGWSCTYDGGGNSLQPNYLEFGLDGTGVVEFDDVILSMDWDYDPSLETLTIDTGIGVLGWTSFQMGTPIEFRAVHPTDLVTAAANDQARAIPPPEVACASVDDTRTPLTYTREILANGESLADSQNSWECNTRDEPLEFTMILGNDGTGVVSFVDSQPQSVSIWEMDDSKATLSLSDGTTLEWTSFQFFIEDSFAATLHRDTELLGIKYCDLNQR